MCATATSQWLQCREAPLRWGELPRRAFAAPAGAGADTRGARRYRPRAFDGWNERHWTLPFAGERFSVVWFTPRGAPPPPPPPPARALPEALRGALPRLCWGSYQLRGEAARAAALAALRRGFRGLDTASAYGNASELRAAVAAAAVPREELFLTSKVGPAEAGYAPALAAAERICQSLCTGTPRPT